MKQRVLDLAASLAIAALLACSHYLDGSDSPALQPEPASLPVSLTT